MITPEKFERAYERLDKGGLTKHQLWDDLYNEQRFCSMGAVVCEKVTFEFVESITGRNYTYDIPSNSVTEAAKWMLDANPQIPRYKKYEDCPEENIFKWNDRKKRTKQEVMDALMDTAKYMRDKGVIDD